MQVELGYVDLQQETTLIVIHSDLASINPFSPDSVTRNFPRQCSKTFKMPAGMKFCARCRVPFTRAICTAFKFV